jgi:hypothetical protein
MLLLFEFNQNWNMLKIVIKTPQYQILWNTFNSSGVVAHGQDRLAKAEYLTGEFSQVLAAHASKTSTDKSDNLR